MKVKNELDDRSEAVKDMVNFDLQVYMTLNIDEKVGEFV